MRFATMSIASISPPPTYSVLAELSRRGCLNQRRWVYSAWALLLHWADATANRGAAAKTDLPLHNLREMDFLAPLVS
jgi:hypothetical protein